MYAKLKLWFIPVFRAMLPKLDLREDTCKCQTPAVPFLATRGGVQNKIPLIQVSKWYKNAFALQLISHLFTNATD